MSCSREAQNESELMIAHSHTSPGPSEPRTWTPCLEKQGPCRSVAGVLRRT